MLQPGRRAGDRSLRSEIQGVPLIEMNCKVLFPGLRLHEVEAFPRDPVLVMVEYCLTNDF